jgi:hypothetical protein
VKPGKTFIAPEVIADIIKNDDANSLTIHRIAPPKNLTSAIAARNHAADEHTNNCG